MFINEVINLVQSVIVIFVTPVTILRGGHPITNCQKISVVIFTLITRYLLSPFFIMQSKLFFHTFLYTQPEQECTAEILQHMYWTGVLSSCEIVPKRIICIICAISLLQIVFHIKTAFCAILLPSFNFSYISGSPPLHNVSVLLRFR